MTLRAILFDKDGTLFDFGATWNAWAARVLADLSEGDAALAHRLAGAVRFDLGRGVFLRDSPVIAGTNREAAALLAAELDSRSIADIEAHLTRRAAQAPLVPAVPLGPLLDALREDGLALGVMTNDAEAAARAHLEAAGVLEQFDFVAGFDSGHGAKPDPAPLLAFCAAAGAAPSEAVMVGDSAHDLLAARAGGLAAVGVLTGMARRADLEPLADAVLPDIGHLPGWLETRKPGESDPDGRIQTG